MFVEYHVEVTKLLFECQYRHFLNLKTMWQPICNTSNVYKVLSEYKSYRKSWIRSRVGGNKKKEEKGLGNANISIFYVNKKGCCTQETT